MLKIIAENCLEKENYNVNCVIVELQNAFLIMMTDQDNYGIGNVMLSAPPLLEGTNAMSTPAPLFGLKQGILDKMISEVAAVRLKKPCLSMVSVNGIEGKDQFVAKVVLDCLKETIEKITTHIKK